VIVLCWKAAAEPWQHAKLDFLLGQGVKRLAFIKRADSRQMAHLRTFSKVLTCRATVGLAGKKRWSIKQRIGPGHDLDRQTAATATNGLTQRPPFKAMSMKCGLDVNAVDHEIFAADFFDQ
jgi:hypothetical protein